MKRLLLVFGMIIIIFTGCTSDAKVVQSAPEPIETEDVKTKSETLRILIQESPPFSYIEEGEVTGFVAEIVKEIMSRQGLDYEMEVLPFKRGYEIVSGEPNVVLCGMTRTIEREDLFKWVGPVSKVDTAFYSTTDNADLYTDLESFKTLPAIGVTLGYYTEQFLYDNGFTNVDATVYPEDMLEKLLTKRTPVILSDNIAISGLLEDHSQVKPIYTVFTKKSYLAFSIGTDSDIILSWQETLKALYDDGTFKKIYEQWLPNETLPNDGLE